MSIFTDLLAWKKLPAHKEIIKSLHMRDFFKDNAERFEDFCLQVEPVFLDCYKSYRTIEGNKRLSCNNDWSSLQDVMESEFNEQRQGMSCLYGQLAVLVNKAITLCCLLSLST